MNSAPRTRTLLVAVAALAALGAGASVYHHKCLWWRKFDQVDDGVYRSGRLHEWQLRDAIERYELRTVFSLTTTNDAMERRVCDELGVRRHLCYLPGDGVGTDDPYLRFLEVVSDPANRPILVHCSAGVQRTGGAVALYRVCKQDWQFDDAIEEMIAFGNEGRPNQIEQLRDLAGRLDDTEQLAGRESPSRR